jgi:hypothetical protein
VRKLKSKRKRGWVDIRQLSAPSAALAKKLSRFAVLQSVWVKETGPMADFWDLKAVKGETVFVHVKSSSANHELDLRKSVLIKSLNKYFTRKWIKQIKRILEK